MNDIVMLCVSFLFGIGLGMIFFLGLRWTVARSASMSHPVLLYCISFLLRGAIVLLGFYWFAEGRVERFALLLLGFMISRRFCIDRKKTNENNS